MTLSTAEIGKLADDAIRAAIAAGQMIARSRPQEIGHKAAGDSLASQVVTDIDRRSQDIILEALAPSIAQFELGLLAEEQVDDGGRLRAEYFWCIDPLDGTLPFVEGVPGSAVSISLVGRDGTPWIGVIYDVAASTLLHAIRGAGAFRDGTPWRREVPLPGGTLDVFADRSFLAQNADEMIDALEKIARDLGLDGVDLHVGGGAVMNACNALTHPPGCYFKPSKPAGGGSLWDFAATACLFREVGAVATDIHGQRLDLNRADSTFMNHRGVLFATDHRLAERIRALRPSGYD